MIGNELVTREPSPIEGVLPLLDPLLCCTPAVVELRNPFHRVAEVCDDEAYSRDQLSLVPLYFGYYSPRNIPTLGLVGEVVIGDDGLSRRPLGRSYQQVRYFPLKYVVSWKPYGVAYASCLHVLVKLGFGEGSVCSKQKPHRHLQVALHDRLDEFLPAIGAMDVAWPENCSFTVSELVEAEQRVIADTLKMAVVG